MEYEYGKVLEWADVNLSGKSAQEALSKNEYVLYEVWGDAVGCNFVTAAIREFYPNYEPDHVDSMPEIAHYLWQYANRWAKDVIGREVDVQFEHKVPVNSFGKRTYMKPFVKVSCPDCKKDLSYDSQHAYSYLGENGKDVLEHWCEECDLSVYVYLKFSSLVLNTTITKIEIEREEK